MENTTENKAKFFAQYFGQEVRVWDKMPDNRCNVGAQALQKESVESSYLELTPLSQISDEDYKGIPNLYYGSSESWFNSFKIMEADKKLDLVQKALDRLTPIQYDYLRSRGYALPYHNLSIDDLIDYKWIQLKNGNR